MQSTCPCVNSLLEGVQLAALWPDVFSQDAMLYGFDCISMVAVFLRHHLEKCTALQLVKGYA